MAKTAKKAATRKPVTRQEAFKLKGERLAAARKARGLSQIQLARRLEERGKELGLKSGALTPSFISNVENNKKDMFFSVAHFVADLLGVSLDYLAGRTEKM